MLPSDGAEEIVVLVVAAGLALVMRWVFKPSRPHKVTRVDATDARELGLLTVVATVDRSDAANRRDVLERAGIRSSASRRQDGRVDVLVFHADASSARRLLADPEGRA